jgi:NAD(P)-dependent dehydrogenase (short-subunit alcohol dehydrogenase family)
MEKTFVRSFSTYARLGFLDKSSGIDFGLDGKAVIVTGAARGIGAAIARAFGLAHADVLLADRMKRLDGRRRCESLATEIVSAGRKARVVQTDVSDYGQVERMVETADSEFGGLDILVANAGVAKDKPALEIDEENWNENLTINAKGCLNCCRAAAKQMIRQGRGGKIVAISSIDGIAAETGLLSYSASKAAVNMIVKCLALELSPYRINVNGIAPGWVESEMSVGDLSADRVEALRKALKERIPLGYMAQPEAIAGGALYLASPLSDYVTGQILVIDGGLLSNMTIKLP